MTDDQAKKVSVHLITHAQPVSVELLQDSSFDLLPWLENPVRPEPKPLTRWERFFARLSAVRLAVAERAYRVISGRDAADVHWEE